MRKEIQMKKPLILAGALYIFANAAASGSTAIFPPNGVNTDKSFVDAFGMLLAAKYRNVSGQDVINPVKAGRAISEDSSLTAAAQKLNVSEYIEIDAVGLYLSRREKAEYEYIDAGEQTIVVKIKENDDDDDDDQDLLDNHKTVVTATRRTAEGERVHTVEMTLVTYGDIEESTDRIARALYQKVSVDEVRGLQNVTRREGLGKNKVFIDNLKGLKIGFMYPVADNVELTSILSIAYNHRFDSDRFFLEFGAGGRLPTKMEPEENRFYGGAFLHMGGSYYLLRTITGLHAGLGVSPHFVIGSNDDALTIGIMPYIQVGFAFPRNYKMQGLINLKIGQNMLPITTGSDSTWYGDNYLPPKESYPTEIGIEMGMAF